MATVLIAQAHAQTSDAAELVKKAKAFGNSTSTWTAEVTEVSKIEGPGMKVMGEIHTRMAAEPSLKMSRVNSGDDRTIMVCDGTNFFYLGDGLTYDQREATQQCNVPLISLYDGTLKELSKLSNGLTSLSKVGEDHVLLSDGDHPCVLIRAEFKQESWRRIGTMCIDPVRPVVLRDVSEAANPGTGVSGTTTRTFTAFELNPSIPPNTFHFTIPPGAAKLPPR